MSSLQALDQRHVIHPYTNLSAHRDNGAMILTRGEGVYVFDDAGNRFIEGMAGLWCASLGYSEKRLAAAAAAQFDTLPFSHLFAHRATPPAIELAAALASVTPAGLDRVFTVNSGSEAVDAAIKMVWYYNNALNRPQKKKFLARKRAYHGVTVAAGSLTGLPYVHDGFDLPNGAMVTHLTTPHHYRYAEPGETEAEFTDRLVEELRATIEREGADTIAAFIAEPVMGAGGVLIPPAGYFEKMQAVLRENDILCI
ncbi:MAG: aminotransferase class III-fold pyridoxal phosphate-dependent enzyme, partial [Pseudomonadota bacterium]